MLILLLVIFGLTLLTVGGAVGIYFLTRDTEEDSPAPAPAPPRSYL